MKRPSNSPERLDSFMRSAHRSRPELELSRQWQADLMGEIADLGRRSRRKAAQDDSVATFSRMLFRFAGAGAVLAAGLLLYAHLYAPDLDRHAAGMVLEQPATPVPMERLIWS